ncbi:MAG: cupin domain-containing protein [Chloroflexi bacterium]|nr:cupin domain-containing protein [Chloroflexota bacterium]
MQVSVSERWWPTTGIRALEMLERGADLSAGERAEAERERAARALREASAPFVRREQMTLAKSSHRGVWIAEVVSPALGLDTHMLNAEIHHLPPGVRTDKQRHADQLMHVLTGSGHSVIEGERIDWEPGDSIHIKPGFWYQHVNTSSEPANFLVGSANRLLEHMMPHPLVYKGDSFSDVSDDFKPEHPFGLGPQEIVPVSNEKWNSSVHVGRKARQEALRKQLDESRTITRWNEAKIERSHHKGDFKVALIDPVLGYDCRLVTMAIHQMPPASYTETHKHEEAIVYIRTGSGYSIIDGERYDWKAGDCMHIQPGSWHQHFNTDPERVSQHIAILPTPLLIYLASFPGFEVVEDVDAPPVPENYEPKLPWEFDYSVPWPKKP